MIYALMYLVIYSYFCHPGAVAFLLAELKRDIKYSICLQLCA